MRPQQEVLRRLVSEYQETRSKKAFASILKRVDDLVISVIYKLVRRFYHLQRVDFGDLYQTAIVGVGEGILAVKDDEDGEKITARIVAYIKAAIRRTFKPTKELSGGGVGEGYLKSGVVSEEDSSRIFDLVEFSQVRCYGNLSKAEKDLLSKRFFEDMTYIEMGKELNCSKNVARTRVLKIIKKFRKRFRDYYCSFI